MQIATMVLIYVLVWWVLFFIALPIGIKGTGISLDTGAPNVPHLRAKAIWVSVIAFVVTFAVVLFLLNFGDDLYRWVSYTNAPRY